MAGVETVDLAWSRDRSDRWRMREIPGSEQHWPADLVLLALGFLGPESELATALGVALDPRSSFAAVTGGHATNVVGVFAAGDCRRGRSLVVWAIAEGRAAARECDRSLMGETELP